MYYTCIISTILLRSLLSVCFIVIWLVMLHQKISLAIHNVILNRLLLSKICFCHNCCDYLIQDLRLWGECFYICATLQRNCSRLKRRIKPCVKKWIQHSKKYRICKSWYASSLSGSRLEFTSSCRKRCSFDCWINPWTLDLKCEQSSLFCASSDDDIRIPCCHM